MEEEEHTNHVAFTMGNQLLGLSLEWVEAVPNAVLDAIVNTPAINRKGTFFSRGPPVQFFILASAMHRTTRALTGTNFPVASPHHLVLLPPPYPPLPDATQCMVLKGQHWRITLTSTDHLHSR